VRGTDVLIYIQLTVSKSTQTRIMQSLFGCWCYLCILWTLQDSAVWRDALFATDFQSKVRFIS